LRRLPRAANAKFVEPGNARMLLLDDSSTLAYGPVASEFGPLLETLASDELG
jgi:hypothetical protein